MRWAMGASSHRQEQLTTESQRTQRKTQKKQKQGNTKRTDQETSLFFFFSVSFLGVLCDSVARSCLLRFGQGPFAGFVPDFVAGQPAPGCLHGEDAGVAGGIPAAAGAGAALTPQTQGLSLQQVR